MKTIIMLLAVMAVYVCVLARLETVSRDDVRAASRTAACVCDGVDRQMQGERVGRVCVALVRLLGL